MRLDLNYTREEETTIEKGFLEKIAEETFKRCALEFLHSKEEISLNAIAVSEKKIRELNKEYLGKDKVTDILSFGEYGGTDSIREAGEPRIFIGELFFSPEFIEKASKEDAVTFEHEMAYVFSHGILHLLGFDHSEKMFAIQDMVTEKIIKTKK